MGRRRRKETGRGILGKRFDRALRKAGGEHLKNAVYAAGDALKPMVKQAIDTGVVMASAQVPMLAPAFIGASGLAKDFLDKPASYGVGANDTFKAASDPAGYAAQSAMNYFNANGGGHMANIYTDPYASLNMLQGTSYGNRAMAQAGESYNAMLGQEYQNAARYAQHQMMSSPVFTGGLNAPSILQAAALQNPFHYNNMTGMPQFQAIQNTATHVAHALSNPNSMSNPLPLAPQQYAPAAPAPPQQQYATSFLNGSYLPPQPVPTSNPTQTGQARVAVPASTIAAAPGHKGKPPVGHGLGMGLGELHHSLRHVVDQMHPIRGMGVQRRHGKAVERGSVGVHGNLLRTPQALVSQPYSVYPMWSVTLPPSYQRFNDTA